MEDSLIGFIKHPISEIKLIEHPLKIKKLSTIFLKIDQED